MINKQFFQKLKKAHQDYGSTRGLIIRQSNLVLHKAKQAIFCLHRDQVSQAESILGQAEKILFKLQPQFRRAPDLRYTGAYKAALEEYIEAKLFWQVLKHYRIKSISNIPVHFDDYVAAMCDTTGEMTRKIVLLATAGKVEQAEKIKNLIAEIVSGLIQLDLTGYLRSKFDAAKRNLKKAEEIMYELKIRK